MYSFLNPHSQPDPVTAQEIADLENRCHLHLPQELKTFYENHNGQSIKPVVFSVDGQSFDVYSMLPLFTGTMPIEHILEIYQPANRFPATFFPIAVSFDGEDYFYDTQSDAVYLIPIEHPSSRKLVCHSITQFFKLLSENA